MTRCPNCLAEGVRRYCPNCGQEWPRELTARAWFGEALDELFFVDARLPRSLRALVVSPGLLMVEWEAGRRARYVQPLRLFLLALALAFLFGRVSDAIRPPPEEALDTNFAFQLVLFCLSVPGIAVLTRLSLLGSGPQGSFLPYVVFSLYEHTALLLILLAVNAVALPVEVLWTGSAGAALLSVLPLTLVFAHFVLSIRRWRDLTWAGAVARGLLVAAACIPLGFVMLRVLILVVNLTYGPIDT